MSTPDVPSGFSDKDFEEFRNDLDRIPDLDLHPPDLNDMLPSDDELLWTELIRADLPERLKRLGFDLDTVCDDMAAHLAILRGTSFLELNDWRVRETIEAILRWHPLVAGTPETQATDPSTGVFSEEQRELRDGFKLDDAYMLISEYGEAASPPLRTLLDDLAPFGVQAADLTEHDLAYSPEGKAYTRQRL